LLIPFFPFSHFPFFKRRSEEEIVASSVSLRGRLPTAVPVGDNEGMTTHADPDSDVALADRAAAGDRAAFLELYRRHAAVVMVFLGRFVTEADREDCLQDTMLRAWVNIRNFTAGNFRSWLFTIARRLAVDVVRRRRRAATGTDLTDQPSPEADSALEQMLAQERQAVLERCLRQLGDGERRLIACAFGGAGSHAEECDRLGVTVPRGYKLRHLAIAKLRICVERGQV
jgi:RNA polymerase sigma-70 factor (ECF subfamily)